MYYTFHSFVCFIILISNKSLNSTREKTLWRIMRLKKSERSITVTQWFTNFKLHIIMLKRYVQCTEHLRYKVAGYI